MANPNIDPVFSRVGVIGDRSTSFNPAASTALTTFDGSGQTLNTNAWVAFTADATNGSFLRSLCGKITTTGAGAASVVRFFINNGGASSTANTALYKEMTVPAITANQTSATPDFEIPCNILLPPSYRVIYTFGTAPVNLWIWIGIGGDL